MNVQCVDLGGVGDKRDSVEQPVGRKEDKRDSVEQHVDYVVGYIACTNPKFQQDRCAMLADMIALGADAIGVSLPWHRMTQTLKLFRAIEAFSNDRQYLHSFYGGEVMWFSCIEPCLRKPNNFEDCDGNI